MPGKKNMKKCTGREVARRSHDQVRETLAAWLREWRIEKALAIEESTVSIVLYGAGRGVERKRSEPPRPGEVRLLRPEDAFSCRRPRYVLVLESDPRVGNVRVVPFSRFSTPAMPGEHRTGHPASPLAVLCAWNVRTLPWGRVQRAWKVARWGAARHAAAQRAVAICPFPDADPPPDTAGETGPPLTHPDDPRWNYLREEAAEWDAIEQSCEAVKPAFWVMRERDKENRDAKERLAAESWPEYSPHLPKNHARKSRAKGDHC